MNVDILVNQSVKNAINALQAGDKTVWLALFSDKVVFTDDGNLRDFVAFTDGALGTEKFLSIDTVENDGCNITGNFDAGKWGQFKVFFRFTIGDDGLISRLDIGQA